LQRLAALHDRRRTIDAEIAGLESEILAGLPQPSPVTPVAPRSARARRREPEAAPGGATDSPRQRRLFSN